MISLIRLTAESRWKPWRPEGVNGISNLYNRKKTVNK